MVRRDISLVFESNSLRKQTADQRQKQKNETDVDVTPHILVGHEPTQMNCLDTKKPEKGQDKTVFFPLNFYKTEPKKGVSKRRGQNTC